MNLSSLESVKIACLLFVAATCNTYAQSSVTDKTKPADFKVGETWEFHRVDNRSKVEEPRTFRTVVEEGSALYFSYSAGKPTPVDKFFENEGDKKPSWIWPLEVDKAWELDQDWTNPQDGRKGNTKQSVKVVAYEEIEVLAGKYMAYKVERKGFFRNYRGNSGGKVEDTYWYSPAMRANIRWIREDGFNSHTQELMSYKPAP